MKLLKLALFPIAFLYGLVMRIRNILYETGFFKSRKFELPVISVGNLTVGGTGKTPHVEYLLNLLSTYKTATLSRGYKRQTTGFILAGSHDSAKTIGDEPFQYYLDFPETAVTVCERRVDGIENIQRYKPETDIIILDDAFQHRAVSPKLNLLITDFFRRFDTDFMLPTGLLREPRSGAGRADAVLVSKCPETVSETEKNAITKNINQYLKAGTQVFFTTYTYGAPVNFGLKANVTKEVFLVTGIANANPLLYFLAAAGYTVLEHFNFPDHHTYTSANLETIKNSTQKQKKPVSIFTTRKDAVKLADPEFNDYISQLPFFYVPIKVKFLENEPAFQEMVLKAVKPEVAVY